LAEQLVDVALPAEPRIDAVRYDVDVREFAAKAAAKLVETDNRLHSLSRRCSRGGRRETGFAASGWPLERSQQ
jgi:hypothetical protein